MAEVPFVRYVALDVVGFTRDRSVEAQAAIAMTLNGMVRTSVGDPGEVKVIYLPTGDGICIGLVGQSEFDAHLRLALAILELVEEHKRTTAQDTGLQFSVRIGLSESSSDNLLTDINGNESLAGAGINTAFRIMRLADGAQVLVSGTVHETLGVRAPYMEGFEEYEAQIKHGYWINVFQYIADGVPGLNTSPPSALQPEPRAKQRLTEFEAYYLAHALVNRERFLSCPEEERNYAGVVLLWFLASDSVGVAHQSQVYPYKRRVFGSGSARFKDAMDYYVSVDFSLTACFAGMIKETSLCHIRDLFESTPFFDPVFANEQARTRLVREHPGIAEEFGIVCPEEGPADSKDTE